MTEEQVMDVSVPTGPIPLKVRDKTYDLPTDQSAVLRAKIQRWVRSLNDRDDEDKAEEESIDLVARALRANHAEIATWLPLEREGVLRFLAFGDLSLTKTRVQPVSGRSVSSGTSTEG